MPGKFLRRFRTNRKVGNNIQYWQSRVRNYGKRSVLNIGHSDDEIEAVTQRQCREIFPHFSKILDDHVHTILDFGCGYGRFSSRLAGMANCQVIGADPIAELLAMAPDDPSVRYVRINDGIIPVEDASVDAVWIALVMGGIPDKDIEKARDEIDRITSARAGLCLVENTSQKPDAPHWYFRNEAWYKSLFSKFDLQVVHTYTDMGESISVMTGKKTGVSP